MKKTIALHELGSAIAESNAIASQHLQVLYKALKGKDPNAVLKKGYIDCRYFRIGFDELGFYIRDLKNFNKKTDFYSEDAFPSPREVWEYITKPRINNADKEEHANRMKKVLKYQKTVKNQSPAPEPVKNEPNKEPEPEITKEYLEQCRKKAVQIIGRAKDGHKLYNKLLETIPNRSYKVYLGKIYRKFKMKKIRFDKFRKQVSDLTKTITFEEKKKPAPKFVGLPFWKIQSLIESETDSNKLQLVIKEGTKDVPYKYDLYKSEFLARYILNIEPGAMPQMFKMLSGEITVDDFLDEPIKRDRFVHFDNKLIRTDAHNETLFAACVELLYLWCEPNPLKIAYKNNCSLEEGDYIRIYYEDNYCYLEGEVITTNEGVQVRYDDGEVAPLMKHQRWEKL